MLFLSDLQILSTIELKINIEKLTIHHALDIYEIMQMVLHREQKVDQGKEHFWVLALNNTDRLIQACRIMNTPVLDHVIITEHSYLSFKDTGLLERLEASLKYVPPYELERQYHEEMEAAIREVEKESRRKIQDVKKESLQKGEKKGIKKGEALEETKGMSKMARQMLAKGLEIKLICDMTGLSEEELSKLGQKD